MAEGVEEVQQQNCSWKVRSILLEYVQTTVIFISSSEAYIDDNEAHRSSKSISCALGSGLGSTGTSTFSSCPFPV